MTHLFEGMKKLRFQERRFITEPSQTELLPAVSGSPPSILLSSPCSDPTETRSCLQPVIIKETSHGIGLKKKNFLTTINHFLIVNTEKRTKYSNKMWSFIVTHLFTQDYHHHAGTYCGSHHHIAGFHSGSVSSSVDHHKPAEIESHMTNFHNVGFFPCISFIDTRHMVHSSRS